MRLKEKEINAIRNSFLEIYSSGEIYLLGSRVHDEKKGGDIDLYIVPGTKEDLAAKKIDFLIKVKRYIGEQKIDVIIDRGQNRLIDRKARQEGILLCRK